MIESLPFIGMGMLCTSVGFFLGGTLVIILLFRGLGLTGDDNWSIWYDNFKLYILASKKLENDIMSKTNYQSGRTYIAHSNITELDDDTPDDNDDPYDAHWPSHWN